MIAKGIWVPPSARESEADQGSLGCHLCKRLWPKRQRREWEQHFAQCISDHREQIEAASPRNTAGGIFEPWNPDVAAHLDQVGKRMIAEGRLTMKKNERVFNE